MLGGVIMDKDNMKELYHNENGKMSFYNHEATQREIEALERQITLDTNPKDKHIHELMLKCLLEGKGGVVTVPKGVL